MLEFIFKIVQEIPRIIGSGLISKLLILGVLLWLCGFIFEIPKNIAIQKLHKQKSWVWYMFFIGTTAFIWVPLILIWPFDFKTIDALYGSFLLFCLVALLAIYWYWRAKKINIKDLLPRRFAAGAVGKNEDALDFRNSAETVAARLMAIKNYVSVVGIYGFPGFGKSSFARMIIESLPTDETLYTYISLTETNEAKDFSTLFAERWFSSLGERYPKIDTKLAVPVMQSILRESGNGIIAPLFELAPWLNKGLKPTTAKTFDPAYPPPLMEGKVNTSSEIANVFGNVQEITEKLWVVMIDEIERARFDEIYRAIEIIERYKNEGRTGLPVRVMFILCVADTELRSYLRIYRSQNKLSYLIEDFFFDNATKSLTIPPIYLPPVSYEKKLQYFKDKLIDFNNSLDDSQKEEKLEENLADVYFDTVSHKSSHSDTDEKKRLSCAFGFIGFLPRLIDRCIGGLYFTFGAYRKESNIPRPRVKMSDLLIMEYIKIKYPYIMSFLTEYADAMRSQFDGGTWTTPLGVATYSEKYVYQNEKKRFADLVIKNSGIENVTEKEKKDIEELLPFACRWVSDFWNSKNDTSAGRKLDYLGTLSDPHALWNYLHMTEDGGESLYIKLDALYLKHKNKSLDFKSISLQDLHDYARFLIDVGGTTSDIYLDVLGDITRRLTSQGEINIKPSDVGDTVYETIVFDFSYTLLNIIEFAKNNAGRSDADTKKSFRTMDDTLSALREVLESSNVTTEAKLIILNSFANKMRGSGSEIHGRFTEAFEYMELHNEADIKELIQYVFSEYKQKYITDKKDIYENEQNFFYVLYQIWSGNANNSQEVADIREIASRNLEKHAEALELYWNRFPFDERWTSYKEAPPDIFERIDSNALYMPLPRLIDITKRAKNPSELVVKKMRIWQDAVGDSDYEARETLSNKKDTLGYILKEEKLL